MDRTALHYDLPERLVARWPLPDREGARLLEVGRNGVVHRRVRDFPELLPEGALLVVNDTRVRRARVLGRRVPGGGRVELLLLRRLSPPGPRERWEALGHGNRPLREGTVVDLGAGRAEVVSVERGGALTVELLVDRDVDTLLEAVGRVPLPPYLDREDEPVDAERYQTRYARVDGSAAAPTAGLHLGDTLLRRLAERGVERAAVTLHVGPGTFRPVTTDRLEDHVMHEEDLEVTAEVAAAVARARARGAPVVAMGTTVVRALESAADAERPGLVRPLAGATRLFLKPGDPIRVVDALFTNFHQPGSTLLALVGAFAGLDRVLAAYAEAIRREYRFLSYGDACWFPERLA